MPEHPMDLRRRVAGWRAAERRERLIRAEEGPMDANDALDAAVELADLFTGDPTTMDATRAREVAHVRATWRRLRTRLACPAVDATNR